MTKTHYIIRTSKAKMPTSCWGTYRRVAVLEVEAGVETVSMISDRARDVISVVQTWEKLNVGITERCAYQQALAEANELCDTLNSRMGA